MKSILLRGAFAKGALAGVLALAASSWAVGQVSPDAVGAASNAAPGVPADTRSQAASSAPAGTLVPALPPATDLPPPLDAPPSAAEDMPNPVEDAAITAKVKSSLVSDAATRASNIDVDAKGGIVTLNGEVASGAEAQRAVQIARAVEGVRSVTNNLRLNRAGSGQR